jgi:SAM-dependent methyltransferase
MQGIEPLLQELRMWKVAPYVVKNGVLVDFGCDEEEVLLRRYAKNMAFAIGIDVVARPYRQENRAIIQADLNHKVPLPAGCANTVTMLAVLEHLHSPEVAVAEACRILKPGGNLLVTVPSTRVAQLLPILGQFGLVRKEMIDQHENYFSAADLEAVAKKAGFSRATAAYWELGCNVFLRAIK